MGYILCTAEKPSVAGDIAKVIGATNKRNGYYEGNGYRVTWAVGHLVGLAEPQDYGYMGLDEVWSKDNPQNAEKALLELPLIPETFKLIVIDKVKDQFEIIKKLMNDPQCDSIIDCGDCGPEGHILQWFIRVKAGCQKPVKRFMATSMTEEAIIDAMNNLQDINKFTPVIKGEFCKKKADWIMGMSLSRGASITYNAKVDVGRVQSPTLFFVVRRYLEVLNFKVKDFYTLKVELKEGFSVFWQKDNQSFFLDNYKDDEKRLLDKNAALQAITDLKADNKGEITVFETTNKSIDRPQLYDITELERDGNRLFGYTAAEVLKTAQSLYEVYKVATYPRTDSRYITHDLQPLMESRVREIATHTQYEETCNKLLSDGLNLDKKIVDDSKVTDHHAILVTDKISNFNFSLLTDIEANILNLIIVRMLVSFSGKYKYKETIVNVKFPNGLIFGASGKMPVRQGWKYVNDKLMGKHKYNDEEDNQVEEQLFNNITLGQNVTIDKADVVPKKTTPPKLHTEASLLTAMENAGNNVIGGAVLKGKGIGTQSTRANIIKQLFDKGYIKNQQKGKTNYLIPTKQGISVIRVLPPDLYSPKITADWENQISDIVCGKTDEKTFMNQFEQFINEKLKQVIGNKIENVDFTYEVNALGKCPWCAHQVVEGSYKNKEGKKVETAYCNNKGCNFSIRKDDIIFKMRTGKNLSVPQLKKLISGEAIEAKCTSKANTTYTGNFKVIKSPEGYANIAFELPKFKPKARKIKW